LGDSRQALDEREQKKKLVKNNVEKQSLKMKEEIITGGNWKRRGDAERGLSLALSQK